MKRLLILTALLPFVCFAQPINTLNNPNLPGYQIPSQQRMQTQMQTQQIQQKGMLNQQLKIQTQLQQQHLENQINSNSQRVLQSQPGELNPARQHMLQERRNGDMLNPPSTSQPDIPLKTIGP
ncbi:DUF2756 family protein [Escherichia albertii]|nr:DUF2756 family protein [Escherichia albertii]